MQRAIFSIINQSHYKKGEHDIHFRILEGATYNPSLVSAMSTEEARKLRADFAADLVSLGFEQISPMVFRSGNRTLHIEFVANDPMQ